MKQKHLEQTNSLLPFLSEQGVPLSSISYLCGMKKLETSTTYIHQLVSEGEHDQQDFKFEISDARKIARSISAFANTRGGRLLVGVKDNGKIAGVRSEEEIYMIEAAATLYCTPQVQIENISHYVEGKTVLEICIPEAEHKPIYAIDEDKCPKAYVRIADENILATPVHLKVWQYSSRPEGAFLPFTERELQLLTLLRESGKLTLTQCCKRTRLQRPFVCRLLADFIRFGLVEHVFEGHTFYYQSLEEDRDEEDQL